MTSTDVRDRARSLADLPNSQLITADDELNSLNETYHDVYDWLLQNDDDYYLTETTTTLTASMISSTNLTGNEYLVPLPADFYRIRYLDWQSNNQWQEAYKFPMSMRDIPPASPMYRIRGNNLWFVGGLNTSYTIRIGYYPSPVQITLPFQTLSFGTSYGPATFQTIGNVFFTNLNETMLYTLGGTTIYAESISNGTVSAPVTIYSPAATVTQLQYYKGYLYWQSATLNIFRGATALGSSSATISATTAVTSTGTVVDFSIYKDTIYYTTSTSINTCTLTGGSTATVASLLTGPVNPTLVNGSVYYVDSSSNLKQASLTTTILASVKSIQSEGTYLYINDNSNNLYRATVTAATLGTVATISTDCLLTHIPEVLITTPQSSLDQVYLPVLTRETPQLLAVGSAAPYTFSYPNNLFTEIMSYQMAMDFKSKAGQDPSLLVGRLGSRDVANQCTGLWLRFYQSIKRDDYQPQRINNRYKEPWGVW